ncbi:hypothetical protein DVS28_b0233 (plasmid) [Euzebya pacifica]|uniref:Uncharacterized protein n=1 Tax=Euzebya pacifica TaxID=1608957 RepID=A0A346Y6A6_9ACTN|nr:hypothetical protein [Euzebya pacifica]AXV10003.1 hypothetical protein DVS28_b0233 [Euzebya pacifica]
MSYIVLITDPGGDNPCAFGPYPTRQQAQAVARTCYDGTAVALPLNDVQNWIPNLVDQQAPQANIDAARAAFDPAAPYLTGHPTNDPDYVDPSLLPPLARRDNPINQVARDLSGMFVDGYTDNDINALAAVVASHTPGWALACVWDFVDEAGCGGDSEIVAVLPDGTLADLPDGFAAALNDDVTPSPADPMLPGPARNALDRDALVGVGRANFARVDRSVEPVMA